MPHLLPQRLRLLQPDALPPTKTPAHKLAALRVQQMNQLCLWDEPLLGGRLNSFRGWRNGADGAACDRRRPASGTAHTPPSPAGRPRPVAGVPGDRRETALPKKRPAPAALLLAPSLETPRSRPFPARSRPCARAWRAAVLCPLGLCLVEAHRKRHRDGGKRGLNRHGCHAPDTPGDSTGTARASGCTCLYPLPNPLILSWTGHSQAGGTVGLSGTVAQDPTSFLSPTCS